MNIASLILSFSIILLSRKFIINKHKTFKISNSIVVSSFFVIIILYIFRLSSSPLGIHVDEVGAFCDANYLSSYGVDRYNNSFPVYFVNYGGGQSALLAYILAIYLKVFKMFGINLLGFQNIDIIVFMLRLPVVSLNILSLFFLYKLYKFYFSKEESLLGLILASLLPFTIMHSRWGLDCYLLYPMLIISLYYMVSAIQTKRNLHYFLSGALFGLSLYSYAISYLIIPIFLFVIFIYLIKEKKSSCENLLLFTLPLIIFAIPLMLVQIVNVLNLNQLEIMGLTITKLPKYRVGEISFSNIKDNIKNLTLIQQIMYDGLDYNAYKNFLTIYYVNIPIVIYGLIVSIKKIRDNKLTETMLLMLLICFMCGLVIKDVNINKLNAIYIPLQYFIFIGYRSILQNNSYLFKTAFLLQLITFICFFGTYYNDKKIKWLFEKDYIIALRESAYLANNSKTIYVIDEDIDRPYIYSLVFNDIDLYDFIDNRNNGYTNVEWHNNYAYGKQDAFDLNGIYIVRSSQEIYELMKMIGFTNINCGDFMVFVYE